MTEEEFNDIVNAVEEWGAEEFADALYEEAYAARALLKQMADAVTTDNIAEMVRVGWLAANYLAGNSSGEEK